MSGGRSSNAQLASELRRSVSLLRRRLVSERDESGPSLGGMAVLCVLERRGATSLGELARLEQVRPPSMTRTVSALEEAGHVRRVPDPEDGRVIRVALTECGHELVVADRRRRDAWLARRLRELPPSERDLLRRAAPILDELARGR